MKHLRRFNESILPYNLAVKDIQEFCEMYLAYLVDDGFNISYQAGNIIHQVYLDSVGTYVKICVNKAHNRPVVSFSSDEIEDRFIPFVYMLNKNYEILDIGIFNKSEMDIYNPTIQEVLNGEIDFKQIVQINIKVKLDFKV